MMDFYLGVISGVKGVKEVIASFHFAKELKTIFRS